jgi:U3 small nucleolar RNA-associated protein 10
LVSTIDSEDPSSRLLAQFVLTELLPVVKPEEQVRLASGILGKIDRSAYMQSLASARETNEGDASAIMEKAYVKPSHQKTAALVQDALLSSLCEINLPAAIRSITLQDSPSDSVQALPRILYRICNSDRVPEDRAKSSLQNLFAQLGHRCLVFLLGVSLDKTESLDLRVVSIRHIQAFITAHAAEGGKLQSDFQCIIPALLILLTDKERKIREVTCFTLRLLRAGSGGTVQSVYGVDDIYGDATRNVQILQPKDLTQYLDDIVASAADISADGSVVQTLHTRILNGEHNESKKATAYADTPTSLAFS